MNLKKLKGLFVFKKIDKIKNKKETKRRCEEKNIENKIADHNLSMVEMLENGNEVQWLINQAYIAKEIGNNDVFDGTIKYLMAVDDLDWQSEQIIHDLLN